MTHWHCPQHTPPVTWRTDDAWVARYGPPACPACDAPMAVDEAAHERTREYVTMGWTLEQCRAILSKDAYEQVCRHVDAIAATAATKHGGAPAHTNAVVERGAGNEPVGAQAGARYDTQVRIHVHCVRRRLIDPDNICAKYAIDGLRYSGVLRDDTPAQIAQVTYSQSKAAKGASEETVITIEPVSVAGTGSGDAT